VGAPTDIIAGSMLTAIVLVAVAALFKFDPEVAAPTMLSEKNRCFIFDVDGTLVDSSAAHAAAWSQAFADLGCYDVPPNRVRTLIGLPGAELVRQLKPHLPQSKRDDIVAAHGRIFAAKYLSGLQMTNGARMLLQELRSSGRRLVAVSSASRSDLALLLETVGLADLFGERVAVEDAPHPKPWPDSLRIAMQRANVAPQEALAVGDSPYDVAAAHAADVNVVTLRCGGWNSEELSAADGVFDDPADLCTALFETSMHRVRR
jgi:HAD superfamily hydrolase (TIGR01509 family)